MPTNLLATAISTSQISLTWDETLNGGVTQISIDVRPRVMECFGSGPNFRCNVVCGHESDGRNNLLLPSSAINLATWSPYSSVATATTFSAGADVPFGALLLWLKADAGLLQSGTNIPIGLWADQSGNGNDASQSSGGIQPIWIPNVIQDRPVIRFNGTNDYLNLPNILAGATGAEAFVVLKASTNMPGKTATLWRMGSESSSAALGYPNTSGQIVEDFGNNTYQRNLGVPPLPLTQFNIYDVASQTTNWAAWLDEVLLYQTNMNTLEVFPAGVGS